MTIQKKSPESGNMNLPLAMTRQQVEVIDLLRGFSTKEKNFHTWYQGAIEIINSQSPDKIAQAAHSLRELFDALPSAIAEVPKFVNPISAVKPLGSHFLEIKAQSYCSGWKEKVINQPLDEVLLRFLKRFSANPLATKDLVVPQHPQILKQIIFPKTGKRSAIRFSIMSLNAFR